MNEPGSVTIWVDKMKAGDHDEAVAQLWKRYFEQLVTAARNHLRGRRGGVVDGEDVALSAFDGFVRAVAAGRFPKLNDRNDLWQVLLMLAGRKATMAIRTEMREKRGGGRVVPVSAVEDSDGRGPERAATGPDPAEAAAVGDVVEELLAALDDALMRQVAVLAWEGYTNEEISVKVDRSRATTERKLRRIREIWTQKGYWQ
jgi:DNA-directed RNA polymerase specialized sigma24 family protein